MSVGRVGGSGQGLCEGQYQGFPRTLPLAVRRPHLRGSVGTFLGPGRVPRIPSTAALFPSGGGPCWQCPTLPEARTLKAGPTGEGTGKGTEEGNASGGISQTIVFPSRHRACGGRIRRPLRVPCASPGPWAEPAQCCTPINFFGVKEHTAPVQSRPGCCSHPEHTRKGASHLELPSCPAMSLATLLPEVSVHEPPGASPGRSRCGLPHFCAISLALNVVSLVLV